MFFLMIGVVLAAFGLEGFILPCNFIDGGVTGISLLLSLIFKVPLGIFLIIVNTPFLLVAWFYMSRKLAIRGALAIVALALLLILVDFPVVTHDKLLSSVFGGMFLGLGIGMAIRGGGVLDGTEVLAYLLSKKSPFTIGNIITLFNVVIFTTAIFIIGVEASLYSIITYIVASKSVDFLLYGFEEYYAVTIISPKHKEIKEAIYKRMDRGVTIFRGEGGYKTSSLMILYCVITKLEVTRIRLITSEIDSNAFVSIHLLKDAYGGLTQKRYMRTPS